MTACGMRLMIASIKFRKTALQALAKILAPMSLDSLRRKLSSDGATRLLYLENTWI